MIVFPNAKINIGLNITAKRSDGFHELKTLMYPVNITDILELSKPTSKNNQKFNLTFSGLVIDGNPEDNLISKAYNLLDKEYNLPPVSVHLHKNIPFGSGLGGGSADASFMLKALSEYFDLELTEDRMEHYSAQLGSDCPFFIKNKPAFASGRGELIEPIDFELKGYYIAIIIPNISINTKEAYSNIKPKKPKYNFEEYLQLPIESWKGKIINDFEDSVFSIKPETKIIKEKLYDIGAVYASLSGSGASLFGIFREEPDLTCFPKDYFTWTGKGN